MARRSNREDLRVCHVNCQSLIAHIDEFRLYFQGSSYHIICVSETWLRDEIPDGMVDLEGFTFFRHDRVGRIGGGVGFFLNNDLTGVVLEVSQPGGGRPEYLIARVSGGASADLLLAVVYRPPHVGYIDDFFDAFNTLRVNFKYSLILGDFNADLNRASFDSRQLDMLVRSSGMSFIPFGATHHAGNSDTFLDLCIVDDLNTVYDFGTEAVNFLSAHDLIRVRCRFGVERGWARTRGCRD